MDVDQPAAPAGPSSTSQPAETVLSTLQSLLAAQQNLSSAYLHPYAPAPWKGKAKATSLSLQEQLARVHGLKDALEGAKAALGGKDAGDWGRLSRALREVTTHQSALFPSAAGLLPPSLPSVELPSPAALFTPVDMLKSLASEFGIQTYLEDSQFGLLKTSLTLAGNRFVVDIDLETDSAEEGEGDNDDDEPMAPASQKPTAERGKVRLAKLAANHVTKEGGTGKSDWIGVVLREALERYLEVWNTPVGGLVEGAKRAMKLEECVRGLREVGEALKWLDDLAVNEEGRDVYSELELVAKTVQEILSGKECVGGDALLIPSSPVFPTTATGLLPLFHLLSNSGASYNPAFCLRPARKDEEVPPIATSGNEENGFPSGWIIQFVAHPGGLDGVPVRSNWLSSGIGDVEESSWNGAIKIENMLHAEGISTAPQTFPYTAEFVHDTGTASRKGMKQHWTMLQPGPDLYMVSRVGLPRSLEGFSETLDILRRQVALDRLWIGVFDRANVVEGANDIDEEADADLDDILSAVPSDVPVSLTSRPSSLDISFPYSGQSAAPSVITLHISPSSSPPAFYSADLTVKGSALSDDQETAIRSSLAALPDGLVALVDGVVRALQS